MKRILVLAAALATTVLVLSGAAQAATCTATGLMRDGINLTAAQIGGAVSGDLNATGCNIGAYNPTSVTSGATIHGANYFGIVANGVSLNVEGASVYQIGESPFNGSQHGVAIYYTNGANGTISDNSVSAYQKGGIVLNGASTSASVTGNTVTGLGPVGIIAQNGIEVYNASATDLSGNTVTENIYTEGAAKGYVSTGILFYQAAVSPQVGPIASTNHVFDNQANITVIS